jgi:hypothetical protein
MSNAPVPDEVQAYLEWLRSKNPNERREAAYQLGERAYADAIPDLIRLYQRDKNRHVRQAAAYALGQFRAVETKLQTRDKDDVYDLLRDVDEGELGKRADKGALIRRIVALLLSLVALVLAYILLPERLPTITLGPIQLAQSLPEDRQQLIDDPDNGIRAAYIFLRDNTNTLQAQFTALLGGQALNCQAFFNPARLYNLSAGARSQYPDLGAIVDDINTGVSAFQTAYPTYDSACFGGAALTAEQVGPVLATLRPAIEALPRIEAALATAAAVQPTAIPATLTPIPPTATSLPPTDAPTAATAAPTTAATVEPTADPASGATLEPTATPEPTLDPNATPGAGLEGVPRHIAALYAIVDDVTSPRGAATLLVRYWQDVVDSGGTTGCTEPRPDIPANYVVLPESDLQASQELAQAVQLVNVGLDAVRNGWVTFRGACNTGGLTSDASNQLNLSRVALNSFNAARQFLDQLSAR